MLTNFAFKMHKFVYEIDPSALFGNHVWPTCFGTWYHHTIAQKKSLLCLTEGWLNKSLIGIQMTFSKS